MKHEPPISSILSVCIHQASGLALQQLLRMEGEVAWDGTHAKLLPKQAMRNRHIMFSRLNATNTVPATSATEQPKPLLQEHDSCIPPRTDLPVHTRDVDVASYAHHRFLVSEAR